MQSQYRSIRTLLLAPALLSALLATAGCLRSPEEKYTEFMESGKVYMEQQDYSSAALQFRNATNVMPQDAEAHYQAALAELRLGRGSASYNLAKKVEQLDPNHKANQMLLAQLMVLASEDDPEFAVQAETRLQRLRAANPFDADVLYLLAATKARVGASEEMEELLLEALQSSPQHLQSSLALARTKLAERDFDGAESVLKQAAADAPDSVAPKLALGQLYLLLNRPEQGAEQFNQVLQIDAQNAQALVGLALLSERAGNVEESERLMQKVSSLEDARYRAFYGRLLLQHEKWDAAIAEFQRILEQDPRSVELREQLLMAYLRADRAPEAEAFLKRLVGENPEDRVLRKQLVGLLVSLNRSGEAEKLLVQALEKNPKDVDALLQRTEIYWRSGRIQQTEQDLAQVLQMRSNSHEAHFFQAKLHQARNQPRLYQQELREAVRIEPEFLLARMELANALRASGDAQSALNLLDEAPASSKRNMAYTVARNWSLIQTAHPDARKMVDAALRISQAPEILLQDGALKLEQRQYAAARQAFDGVLKQEPENIRALAALAQTYVAENQRPQATELILKHVAAHPGSALLQNYLGGWYAQSGYRSEARQAYQAALASDANFVPARLAQAQLDLGEGKFDAARQGLRGVLSIDPYNVAAMVYLSMAEEASNNHDAAIAGYQKALNLEPEGP